MTTVLPRSRDAADTDRLVDAVCRRASDVRGDVRDVVSDLVDRLAPLLGPVARADAIERSVARLDGLDAIGTWLADPLVDEVLVNRGREIWVDRGGAISHVADLPVGTVDVVLERVLAPLGKRIDRTTPIVDARLPDGARLCAVVAPVAVDGTTVAIRRHRRRRIPVERFAAPAVCQLLDELVRARANLLVTGATSSGKTTLLAALLDRTAATDRLVAIEDTAELALPDRHCVRLEARPPGVDGLAAIEVIDLVRAALRLRPDRLVVGEFRGGEVLAVVQALNTGHDGSLSTCHANGPVDALRRVETLVLQAAPSWPLPAIRRQLSRSIDAVVHVARAVGGERRITEVIEVVESDDEPTGRPLAVGDDVVARFERGRA